MRSVLSISLPEDLAGELARFARETGRNKSDVVKESISRFLWDVRFEHARRPLVAKARRRGLITDEDLFRSMR